MAGERPVTYTRDVAEIESKSGEIVFFTDWSELPPPRREAFEQMCAEMEADRAAEDKAKAAS